jgi:hypothetical protein
MVEIRKKKPLGIVIITILTVISGLILLTMSFFSFIISLPIGPVALMGSGFLFILGIASIIVSIGLYRGNGWSWTLLLVLSGFGAAGYLLNIVNGQRISIIGLIINLIIIYYLYRPNVRRFFSKR